MTIKNEQEYLALTEVQSLMTKRGVNRTKPLHILYSYEFRRPVAATNWLATINSLGHRHINCYIQFGLNHEKNQWQNYKLPADWDNLRGWEWQYDINLQQYVYEPGDLTWDQKFYFRLTFEKAAALDKIHSRINNSRRYYVSDVNAQHQVYARKAQEAHRFLASESADYQSADFPFLSTYADLAGIDANLAAREIVLQNEFMESRLIETELIRLKYSRSIHDAQDILELKGIINDFYRETVGHATT